MEHMVDPKLNPLIFTGELGYIKILQQIDQVTILDPTRTCDHKITMRNTVKGLTV